MFFFHNKYFSRYPKFNKRRRDKNCTFSLYRQFSTINDSHLFVMYNFFASLKKILDDSSNALRCNYANANHIKLFLKAFHAEPVAFNNSIKRLFNFLIVALTTKVRGTRFQR